MTSTKITVTMTAKVWNEFVKFSEAKDRCAIKMAYVKHGVEISILSKPQAFEEINRVIKKLEADLFTASLDRDKYKEWFNESEKKKKYFWQK